MTVPSRIAAPPHDQNADDSDGASPPARRGGGIDPTALTSDDSDDDDAKHAGRAAGVAPAVVTGAPGGPTVSGAEGVLATGAAKEAEKEQESYVWRFPLQEYRKRGPERLHSEEFELDGEKWRLLLFPKGNPNYSIPGCMAAYLEYRSSERWYTQTCHFKFRMLHPSGDETRHTAWRDSTHTFTHAEVDRGFNDLLKPDQIVDFTFPDGSVAMCVAAWKAPPGYAASGKYEAYVPYDSKALTGFCGILNQGATCYMNSMLQALFLLPKFREVVYSIPTDLDDKGAKIGWALQRVFYALQTGSKGVSTKALTTSFGWTSIDAFQQHDAQEFTRVLLDSLDMTTRKTPLGPLIHDLFAIKSQSMVRCLHVDFKSRTPATDWDLALVVKGCKTLEDSFKQYLEVETLDGDNKYRAEGHGLQAAQKGIQFLSLPPILQLQLRRFEYDPMRDQMMKINDRFEFPTEIDLTPYISDESGAPIVLKEGDEKVIYSLHSVLVHSGGVHGGHYYSFVRPFSRTLPYEEAPWYKFDDETVSKTTEAEAVAGNYGGVEVPKYTRTAAMWGAQTRVSTTSAYMLVYIRKSSIQTMLAVGSGQGEPKHAEQPIAPVKEEGKEAAVVEPVKAEGEEKKEVVAPTDEKKEAPAEPFAVPIPESLITRLKAEEAEALQRYEERKKAAMYMDLRIVCEESLKKRRAVGVDFSVETYDVATGFWHYNTGVEVDVKVLRKDTFASETTTKIFADRFGIPPERQEFWTIAPRVTSNNAPEVPRVHARIEPHTGRHSHMSIEQVMRDPLLTTGVTPPVLYLRDSASDSRPKVLEAPLQPPAGSTLPQPEPLPEGSLTSENTHLMLFKFWDVPTQRFIFAGSAHFSHSESLQTVREYAASLLAPAQQAAAAAATPADPTDELATAMSTLSVKAGIPTSDILTCFERNGHIGTAPPFNYESPHPPSDPEEAKRWRQPQDWSAYQLAKVQPGEICVFAVRYTPAELEQFRAQHEQAYQNFKQQHFAETVHTATQQTEPTTTVVAVAGATQTTNVPAPSAPPAVYVEPVKARFCADGVAVIKYLADRMVVEFRALPYAPPKPHAAPVSAGEKDLPPPVQTIYQPRAGVTTLEVSGKETYLATLEKLGEVLHIDPQRLKVFKPSLQSEDVPDISYIRRTVHQDPDQCALQDLFNRYQRDPKHVVLYYSVMEYTWAQLEKNHPIVVNYCDANLVQWTFKELFPKTFRFSDVARIAWERVEELRHRADPSHVVVQNPPARAMHYFAIDHKQTVRELNAHDAVTVLKDFPIDGQWTVNLMETGEDELALIKAGVPADRERIIWMRRYYPLGGHYWKPNGLPFRFVAKARETIAEFRVRLAKRLNYDDAKMAQIDIAKLTQTEATVAKMEDEPWELLADDLRGVWTALGLFDPQAPKNTSHTFGVHATGYRSNAAVKFQP